MTLEAFLNAWHATVREWGARAAVSPDAARALLLTLLRDGLGRADWSGAAPADELVTACETELVRLSGEFDAEGYREANPSVAASGEDPATHFCREGWHGVRNPNKDFDVWWYVTEYLDPTNEAINPFVHYLLDGRRAGLQPLPIAVQRSPTAYPPGHRPRRICLFAGYDIDAVVDDYVVSYIAEVSRHADVYYLADTVMPSSELAKLAPYTQGAWGIAHGEYDFGSYSRLARELVGWDVISQYDELLLVNDSCYLLRDLDEVFERMDVTACDWWGLQLTAPLFDGVGPRRVPIPVAAAKREYLPAQVLNYHQFAHIGSYFIALRAPVTSNDGFRRRLDAVCSQASKLNVIFKYETGTTRYLVGQGFDFATYLPDLYPYHPVYGPWVFDLAADGFPVLKRQLLAENPFDVPDLTSWKERTVAAVPSARVDVFERNLLRVAPADKLARSMAVRTLPDGHVETPRLLSRPAFRAADRATPTMDDWWAFPVPDLDGAFAGGVRAVFEEVRDDATLTKVILTRGRAVRVTGANVRVVPLRSPEGQELLMRCGHVFVESDPRSDALWPLPPTRHGVISLWHGVEVHAGEYVGPYGPVTRDRLVERLEKTTAVAGRPGSFPAEDASQARWDTGVPAWDLLVRPHADLPPDLQEAESQLRSTLGGQGLATVVPRCGSAAADDAVRAIEEWAVLHGLRLGIRTDPRDRRQEWAQALAPYEPLDLGRRRYPDTAVVVRGSAVLLTDDPYMTLMATVAGCPVLPLHGVRRDVAVPPRGRPAVEDGSAGRLVARVRADMEDRRPHAGQTAKPRRRRAW